MKRIYLSIKARWQAETPVRARMVKTALTWIAGSAVAVSVGFDTMPASLQSYLPQTVLSFVAGFMCANDVTARDIQKGDKQWVRGKSIDTFFPTGPWLVTLDEVEDPHALDIWCKVNGTVMQTSNTRNLVFNVNQIIAHLSQTITLQPGDIISTGTPGGVGVYRTPPLFLRSGDVVQVGIQKLGVLTNHVE